MNELKPCPFCGRKAELGHTEKDSEYGKTAFVYCTNCGANGKMIEISPKYGADEKAIEAWNRRVNEDAPTADVVERQKGWIPCSERLPENTEPVNITWVNHKPVSYYADIKDQPYTGTGIYCNGKWWWYSVTCQDYLDEYGKSPGDDMDEAIEVLAWMPLPEPYQSNVEEKTDE